MPKRMTNSQIFKTVAPVLTALVVVMELTGCAGKTTKVEPKTATTGPAKTNAYDAEIQKAAAEPMAAVEGSGWKSMFDGKTLAGWKETDFGGKAQVSCQNGLMILDAGNSLTGVNWTNDAPKVDYEISLEAM